MTPKSELLTHLHEDYNAAVRDPLWKNIPIAPALLKIVNTPLVQTLARIKQLGPSYLIYPGAVHTRLGHSLGVFHLSRRLLLSLLPELRELPFDLTIQGVKAFLCAALLHDLGHFPYAHSLKELPLKDHEALTGELILENPLRDLIREQWQVDPLLPAAIVDKERDCGGNPEIALYRELLSGVLDPDKLDYLNRDAFFCGVPYGLQDTDFILRQLTLSTGKPALKEEGRSAVENVLFSKYLMYGSVYWHKTVRVATAMVKKGVMTALEEGVLRPEELYFHDDESFFHAIGAKPFPPLRLLNKVHHRELYKVAAWLPVDNSWRSPLEELSYRRKREAELAARLGLPEEAVIVDIPEPIRFEVSLPLLTAAGPVDFDASPTAFTPSVVNAFTTSLRRIRLMLPPGTACDEAGGPPLPGFDFREWLHG